VTFWLVLQIVILAFIGLFLLIGLSNLWALRRLGTFPMPASFPRVSILVPARNEETNIADCISSLLAQDYPDFEVIVLDDDSTDRTHAILTGLAASSLAASSLVASSLAASSLAATNPRLKIIRGQPLPDGWVGMNWACHQLAEAAASEVILFTDADTRHAPDALRHAVAALIAQKADFLSAVPHEQAVTWSERISVPFFSSFSIFALLPLALAYRVHAQLLSAANGQFKLFRREAYQKIGGHYAIRAHALEDLSLVRECVTHKLRWRLMSARRHVRCRMYRGYHEVLEGFSKNIFAGYDYRLLPYISSWLWLEVLFWEPLLVIGLAAVGVRMTPAQVNLAALAIAMSLVLWSMLYLRFRHPLYLAVLYPATMVFIVIIAWRSLALTLAGRTTWKGRRVTRPRIRIV
jgi:chlorobactene glucosyltransferase